jgi:hypothetical protein
LNSRTRPLTSIPLASLGTPLLLGIRIPPPARNRLAEEGRQYTQ